MKDTRGKLNKLPFSKQVVIQLQGKGVPYPNSRRGNGGLESHCILGGTPPSPFAALSFPNSKKTPFTAGLTQTVFQSSHSEAHPRTHNPTATFCTITSHSYHHSATAPL